MTARRCIATTKDGTPCRAYALAGSDYCYQHDPDRAVERREARSRGGRARHGRHLVRQPDPDPIRLDSLADIVILLQRTIDDTVHLENSIQRARTIGYLASLLIKAWEVASLEQRIFAIECTLRLRRRLADPSASQHT
jgi:hypothetical protein